MLAARAWLTGVLFGFGLILGGMTNPAKVLGFLDLAGRWDPSLAFVMGGAMTVMSIEHFFAKKRDRSLLGGSMQIPTKRTLDRRLVAGSLAFGIGWGIGGFCPGPALVAVMSGAPKALVFVGAMLFGMALFEVLQTLSRPRA